MTVSPLPLRSAPWLAAALLGLGGLASAQLTSIGPFNATDAEGFETQDLSGGALPTCVADRVFDDQADLCAGVASAFITDVWWSSNCVIQEHTGLRFFGTTGSMAVFTFDGVVLRFGGYFGSFDPNVANGLIEFYDVDGALAYSDVIVAPNDCTWTWNGWDFGLTPIREIVVRRTGLAEEVVLLDSLRADIVPSLEGVPFCSCDGSASPPPCGNVGGPGRGCLNSTGSSAGLDDSGLPSVTAASSYALKGFGLVPGTPALYFEGKDQVAGGFGSLFGDGLRCAGGSIQRMEIVVSSSGGESSSSVDIPAATGVASGETRYYQLWYRDPSGGPCGAGFNLTNGLAVTWLP